MRGFLKLSTLQLKLFVREPIAVFFTLALPLMLLFLFGAIFGNGARQGFGGLGSVDVSVPGYAAMSIASAALVGFPVAVALDRERGFFRRLKLTPLGGGQLLWSYFAVYLLMSVGGVVTLLGSAALRYDLRVGTGAAELAAAFLLSMAGVFGVGFLLAALSPTARVTQSVALLVLFPMLFLSGATIPREVFPESLLRYTEVLPLTHAVNLLRGIWAGDAWGAHVKEVVVLLGFAAAGMAVSRRAFRWE